MMTDIQAKLNNDTQATERVRFNMRFPDGLRDRLTTLARAARRSRNAEIIDRIARDYSGASTPIDFTPHRGSDQTVLFMSEALHEELQATAKRNGRSLNTEIVFRLLCSLDEGERAALPLATDDRKTAVLTVRLSEDMRTKLDELSQRGPYRISIASIIERGIELAAEELAKLK